MNRNAWGEDPVAFHLRLVLKARELKLRGADDRRLRRWVSRKWIEFRRRRSLVKCICLGLGYGRGISTFKEGFSQNGRYKLCPYTCRYCPAASGGRCHGLETCKEKRKKPEEE